MAKLDATRAAARLVIYHPNTQEIEALIAKARRTLPELADAKVVHRVVAQNPDSVWAIARAREGGPSPAEGFFCTLPLNALGLRELVSGVFDGGNPNPAGIASPGEKAAGIYIWAAYAPGRLAFAVALVFEKLAAPQYRNADLFVRATTADGHRFSETLGFTKGVTLDGVIAPDLYVFRRSAATAKRNSPAYDSHREDVGTRELSVTVARSFDDLMRVVSMRSAVYLAEQECPFDEEFDGNDLAATHLLGYVGTEPAGCLRIRYFASFAKLERLAVRKEFRNTRLAFQLVRAGIELCRKKGYRKLYGHAQKRLVDFWSRFGFRVMDGGKELVFSDFDYVEMVAEPEAHPEAIAIGVDPYVIIRPEGRWHLPGTLERSASREVTRPSVRRDS